MSGVLRPPEQGADDFKLQELILYIARKQQGDDTFGSVKLNKILFYIDFLAYCRFGRAVTGHPYQRLQNGPAPRLLLGVRRRLVEAKRLRVESVTYHGYTQERPIALDEPKLGAFNPDEIALADEILEQLKGYTGTEVSELSHRFAGWQLAVDKEDIPYSVALVATLEPTPHQVAHARKLEGLLAAGKLG